MGTPSALNSFVGSGFVDAVFCAPSINRLCHPLNSYKNRRPAVYGLFLSCGPVAIFFAVAKLVVFSFQRCVFWSAAHIGYKPQQPVWSIRPFCAHIDASTAIVFVCSMLRVVASSQHVVPRCILRSFAQAVRLMRSFWRGLQQASTRLYSSSFNVRKSGYFWSSARADKKQSVFRPNVLNSRQKPESFFKQV